MIKEHLKFGIFLIILNEKSIHSGLRHPSLIRCVTGSKNLPNLLETEETGGNNCVIDSATGVRVSHGAVGLGSRTTVTEVQGWWTSCMREIGKSMTPDCDNGNAI